MTDPKTPDLSPVERFHHDMGPLVNGPRAVQVVAASDYDALQARVEEMEKSSVFRGAALRASETERNAALARVDLLTGALVEQAYEYTQKTNDLVERHAKQIEALQDQVEALKLQAKDNAYAARMLAIIVAREVSND